MLNVEALINHINTVAADDADSRLSADWSADWAWTMTPVEAENLPDSVPMVVFYQGRELWSKREGSPCHQSTNPSVIVALVICDKRQLAERLKALRSVIYGWCEKSSRECRPLSLSDDPALPCDALEIKGDYIWWQDNWFTAYALTST